MAFLFVVSFVAFVLFLIWGIAAKIQKKNSRWKLLVSLLSLVVSIIALAVSPDPNTQKNQTTLSTSNESDASAKIKENNQSLGITIDDFQKTFNSIVDSYNLEGLHISKFDLTESEGTGANTLKFIFNENLSMVGTFNSDKNIQEVMLIGTKGFSEETGGNLMTAITTLIMTMNNDYTFEDSQGVLKDIGLLDDDVNLQDFDGATVRDGIKYRFKITDDDMNTFSIQSS